MKDPTDQIRLLTRAGRGRWLNGEKLAPVIIVIHIQEGENDLPSYFAGIQSDSTHWAKYSGSLVRMMLDSDTVWTNGFYLEPINHANPVIEQLYQKEIPSNVVSLTVEIQGFAGKAPTEAQYKALGKLVAFWCLSYKIPCDRLHVVGHYEIGEHKQCPGKAVSIERIVAEGNIILNTQTNNTDPYGDPQVWHCVVPSLDFWVVNENGILQFWRDTGGLEVWGYPQSGAYVDPATIKYLPDGAIDPKFPGIVMQWFQRGRIEYHRLDKKIYRGLVGTELLQRVGLPKLP
jgi:hypothetical protein